MTITIPVDPIPQPRPKFGNGRAYQPKRIVEYKEVVKLAGMSAMRERKIIEREIAVTLIFYRKYSPTSRSYGDFDNLAKAVCDALNGIVYKDDSQIVRCVIEKRCDKENPRVEIDVSPIEFSTVKISPLNFSKVLPEGGGVGGVLTCPPKV